MGTEAVPPQFWGVTRPIARAASAVALLFVILAVLATAIGLKPVGAVLVWLICLLVLLVVWRCYVTPYVELTLDRIVVQGPFAHHEVPYGEIRDIQPGMYGLRIETTTQGRVIGWAVQKSALAGKKRCTRSDEVVEQIRARMHDASLLAASTR